jgi:hypothetical protein
VIGTSSPYNPASSESRESTQMLLDMERQPVTEMELIGEEDQEDITGYQHAIIHVY